MTANQLIPAAQYLRMTLNISSIRSKTNPRQYERMRSPTIL